MDGANPRREVWEIPLGAFKEAILNALSHRDYYEQGATTCIEVYDDRVEISNPGGLLPLVARDFGHRSLTRNPLVFSFFTHMRLVEHIGSGIIRMQREMAEAQLPAPVFSTEGFFTVTLYRKSQRTAQPAVSKGANATLTDNQQTILHIVRSNPKATTGDIIRASGLKKTSVYKHLRILQQLGFLKKSHDGLWESN